MTKTHTLGHRQYSGSIASRGFAFGKLLRLDAGICGEGKGGNTQNAGSLVDALEQASAQLAEILESLDDEQAAGIMEFQLAMLEDTALTDPVLERITQGEPALDAWRSVLDSEIEDYRNAEDDYFRARSTDLCDIRDRVSGILAGDAQPPIPENRIVVAKDLTPSRFLSTIWGQGGIALAQGSVNSHVAMLARARNVPMITGVGAIPDHGDVECVLDAEAGLLLVDVDEQQKQQALQRCQRIHEQMREQQRFMGARLKASDGSDIKVFINIADPAELELVDVDHCDGIGLVRTEFLFDSESELPNEEQQYVVYRRIVDWAGSKPVVLRTLDAGADKPVKGLTLDHESNPFMGIRGIRLSLKYPQVFAVQLRAMLRAAAHGTVKIMLPMITVPEEFEQARELLREQQLRLESWGIESGNPELGIMVEVPAVAICIDRFDADFYSIGSNDLLQYLTACSRDAVDLEYLNRKDNPALAALVKNVIDHASKINREVSLCGEMAGETDYSRMLLALGLRRFSVSPSMIGPLKQAITRSVRA